MSADHRRLHNLIAAGRMNDALAGAFSSLGADVPTLAIRSICVSAPAEPMHEWPSMLFQENVAFNWLFLDASDMGSPGMRRLLTLARKIAPTLVFCHGHETEMDTDRIEVLTGGAPLQNGHGIIFSCYTESTFHAPALFRAFSPKVSDARPGPAWPVEAVRVQDPCYGLARELILSSGKVSLSLVQRTLKLSYTRASQLLDAMVGDILERDPGGNVLSIRQGAQATGPAAT